MKTFLRLAALLAVVLMIVPGCRAPVASPPGESAASRTAGGGNAATARAPAAESRARRFVVDGYAYVPRFSRVQVIDVRDPAHPQIVGGWEEPGIVGHSHVYGKTLYVPYDTSYDPSKAGPHPGGVDILDVSDPAHAREIGRYTYQGSAQDIAIDAGVMYVASQQDTRIVDIRRPYAPVEAGSLALPAEALEIAGARLVGAWGSNYYRSPNSGSVGYADITDPWHPGPPVVLVNNRQPAHEIAVAGRYAYLAGAGVWAADIGGAGAPAAGPSILNYTGAYRGGVEVSGNRLFVGTDDVYVYDLSLPPQMVEIARLPLSSSYPVADMALLDGYLYAASQDGRLVIVDVRDPAHPAAAGAAGPTPIPPPAASPSPTRAAPPPPPGQGLLPPGPSGPEALAQPLAAGASQLLAGAGRPALGGGALQSLSEFLPAPLGLRLSGEPRADAAPYGAASAPARAAACARFGDPPSGLDAAVNRPAAPDPPLPAALSGRPVRNAVHTLYVDATVARLAAGAGFDTVVQVFPWRDLNPGPGVYTWAAADDMVRNALGAGLNLVVRLDQTPEWARTQEGSALPFDLAAYADYVSAAAARYRGRVAGYIVWNEPNVAAEWRRSGDGSPDHWFSGEAGVADPADYVGVLGVAFRRIRAADPAAQVVSAGLAPTVEQSPRAQDDLAFFHGMLDAGVLGCADVLGQHAYGYGQDPEAQAAGQAANPAQPGLDRVAAWQALLAQHGGAKPVWITEVGYTVAGGQQPAVSPERQGAYLAAVLGRGREAWPWVEAVTVWNLSYGPGRDDEAAGFSLVDAGATPRPAYAAVQRVLRSEARH